MSVNELVKKIYDFDGNAEEWLGFEKEVRNITKKFTEEELEELVQSEAMESLLMVCDGIRYSMDNEHEKEDEENENVKK